MNSVLVMSTHIAEARPIVTSGTVTFQEMFTDHARFVWRVLRYLGVGESDLDDVCQEVFLVVHRRLADFEGRSSTRTWVYGIALRVAADYRKGRAPLASARVTRRRSALRPAMCNVTKRAIF